jgi:hypothetical protein
MVTAQLGALTSANAGDGTTSTTAQRVLVDFKDALIDYKATSLDVIGMFCEGMTTDTGGDIDLTIAKPSMTMEEIDEGTTPKYQHTALRNERISVKEWGMAVAVTRRMIEDSRFNEVELALNEAKRAVERHVTKHAVYALMGIYNATLGTGYTTGTSDIDTEDEVNIADFSKNKHGAFFGASPNTGAPSGVRLAEYGEYSLSELDTLGTHYIASSGTQGGATRDIAMEDITQAIELMGAKGMNPDTILVSPSHMRSLLELSDFTVTFATGATGTTAAGAGDEEMARRRNSGIVGSLYGLKVVESAWCPQGRYGIFDTSVKPMAFVERRGLTVEEANPGFGIVGSYLSQRYGLKIVRPESGVIVYSS